MSDELNMMGLIGYLLAKEHGQLKKGVELCTMAIHVDPVNSDSYLFLGKTYLIADKRDLAIKTFKAGLKIRRDDRIIRELKNMGIRKSPPFYSLSRGNRLNIVAGRILRTMRLR
ncbi:MAG: tetratricopeptide repeat protein [Desulfuromonadaceae bacterium]